MDIKQLHEQIIYPVVRVRSAVGGGSGTIIYSAQNKEGDYETYVLTNHHVIEPDLHIKERFDYYLNRKVKEETRDTVYIEVFKYQHLSHRTGATTIEADIMAHKEGYDLALVKLREIDKFSHIAPLYPKGQKDKLKLFEEVYVAGCALGHDTCQTRGQITSLMDEIDNMPYIMSTAQIIYGNSGGALFIERDNQWQLLGVPARIPVIFGETIVHMGYSIHADTLYKFFDEEMFQFLYDPKYTSEQCAKMRERKKKQAESMIGAMGRGYLDEEQVGEPESPVQPDPPN